MSTLSSEDAVISLNSRPYGLMRNWSRVPGSRSEKWVPRKSLHPRLSAMRNAAASWQRASHSDWPTPSGLRFGRRRVTVDFRGTLFMLTPGGLPLYEKGRVGDVHHFPTRP